MTKKTSKSAVNQLVPDMFATPPTEALQAARAARISSLVANPPTTKTEAERFELLAKETHEILSKALGTASRPAAPEPIPAGSKLTNTAALDLHRAKRLLPQLALMLQASLDLENPTRKRVLETEQGLARSVALVDGVIANAKSIPQRCTIDANKSAGFLARHIKRAEDLISELAKTSLSAKKSPTRSKNFILADMDGRGSKDNRACVSCIAKLSPFEVAQVNWHVTADQACRLCQVEQSKPEAYTKPFCDFLTENPTVFHAVDYFKTKLDQSGFTELSSRDSWADKLEPGGKYWATRNGSSLIAFTVGKAYKPGNGVGMVGGHIDALTAKLKPVSNKPNKAGFVQLGVAPYAGGLNTTWWDRDLSIGGRVVVQDDKTGKTATRLVKLDWPIAKIPTLAPHFGVGMMGKNNAETEAVPIIGLESASDASAESLGPAGSFVNTQPPRLVKMIAKELGIESYGSITNWELELYDSQPAQTLGLDRELITAGRIDDKLCSWSAFMGLLASKQEDDDSYIKLVALFDDEEIGSLLRQGAKGNFLPLVIERAVEALNPETFGPGLLGQTYAKSFLVSADVTHAGNPNFLSTYLADHIPKLNVGMVISGDSNGHMTTDAVSTAILQRVGKLSDCTTQTFQIRNDSRSGGTIGPSLSSMMGVRSADAGLAQMSMHSIRATIGSLDPGLGVKFFKGFFDYWEKIDGEWA